MIAVTAFIGSIFGAGGGEEATTPSSWRRSQNALGADEGRAAWEDVMLVDDPEAPTTIEERFDYGPLTGGEVTGSVPIDDGSVVSLDLRDSRRHRPNRQGFAADVLYEAADAPPRRQASNFLLVEPDRRRTAPRSR